MHLLAVVLLFLSKQRIGAKPKQIWRLLPALIIRIKPRKSCTMFMSFISEFVLLLATLTLVPLELLIKILLQREEDIMKTFASMQRKEAFTKMADWPRRIIIEVYN